MIIDALLDIFFDFAMDTLKYIPFMDIEMDLSVLNGFLDVISLCLYFFPWQKLVPIVGIIMLLQLWRIVISIIKVIWELLPLA